MRTGKPTTDSQLRFFGMDAMGGGGGESGGGGFIGDQTVTGGSIGIIPAIPAFMLPGQQSGQGSGTSTGLIIVGILAVAVIGFFLVSNSKKR